MNAKEIFKNTNKVNGCWLWTRAKCTQMGYGAVRYKGKMELAHRAAWQIKKGPIPAGLFVCHRCDTPLCIRPSHLFLGTTQDNTRDRQRKNRFAAGDKNGSRTRPESLKRGENNPNAKLSKEKVIQIRTEYSTGNTTQYKLADKFDVSQKVICGIVNRKMWKHIT